ncbi:TM2 domain-containing protein [Natronogracilivirga saccharolytica]|uniref:TM2 domain-containing protein n=1 Tax=Natronogracilivirga saccharolytica TaxID=2812953 RepID=A0A8J7RIP1_9BACT|nr:TM2 domain-containing protein [Natronogracilivirga saccharolytica]MBP3191340.1 TM2 domain-containing protein [Natronogracilivirga saccharolytica]
MEKQQVDMFIMSNNKFFEPHQISSIRQAMLNADESTFLRLQATNFKDPIISLVISLIAGPLGVDRFVIGDVGLGIAKLLTCGGFGIWTIVDYFLIMGRTREVNYEKIQEILHY